MSFKKGLVRNLSCVKVSPNPTSYQQLPECSIIERIDESRLPALPFSTNTNVRSDIQCWNVGARIAESRAFVMIKLLGYF